MVPNLRGSAMRRMLLLLYVPCEALHTLWKFTAWEEFRCLGLGTEALNKALALRKSWHPSLHNKGKMIARAIMTLLSTHSTQPTQT